MEVNMRKIGLVLFIGILLCFTPFTGESKEKAPESIKGRVTDIFGNGISGVLVKATASGTNKAVKTQTDAYGVFVFKELSFNLYALTFEKSGFKSTVVKDIRVENNKTAKVNIQLEMKVSEMKLEAEEAGKKRGFLGGILSTPSSSADAAAPVYYPDFNTEEYERIYENIYLDALINPLSTFSIDVDTASYANIRRFIKRNALPPKDAVRIEEMINYFSYDYPLPKGKDPFSIITEISSCPWSPSHRLIHIGLQGKKLKTEDLPPSNLVFLIDVSGSMSSENKISLLKSAFKLLVKQLGSEDKVSLVVYAGAAGLVLPSTPGSKKEKIIEAIDDLRAGGSTAGGAGIKLAYKVAMENFIKGGNNRVILATDGDFNVGVSSTSELVRMIEEKRKQGIFLTTLGFGMGNYKDHRMEQLADKGNGNYYYIDSLLEAKKVFIDDMRGTLFTIAKDVKIQIEFNPAKVKAYRLIGYENRMLKKEDFADDTKDAGELGSGHTVTVLYEIIPYGSKEEIPGVDELKYQNTKISPEAFKTKELLTLKLRYKQPDGEKSKLIVYPLVDKNEKLESSSYNFKFSAAVAQFGMLLRDSEFKGSSSYESILKLAKQGKGSDPFGYRAEFIKLVEIGSLLDELDK